MRELSLWLTGEVMLPREAIIRIQKALKTFKAEDQEKEAILTKASLISDQIGLRNFAKLAGIDAGNLSYHLNGKRTPSPLSLGKIQIVVLKFDQP